MITLSSENKKKQTVKAMLIKAKNMVPKGSDSKASTDPTAEQEEEDGLISPPYPLEELARFRETSSALSAMVDAYKTNIAGFGYKLYYNVDINSDDIDEAIKEKAKQEWVVADNFYKYCNFDSSFCEILQKVIDDREYMGFGCMEVITDGKGRTAGFEYVPAHTIRISKIHPDPQPVTLETVDENGKTTKIIFQKCFRRYCQKIEGTNTTIWFKEFGDPRRMDKNTGKFEIEFDSEGNPIKTDISPEDEASSLLVFNIPAPYTVYGLPRWLGNMMNIQGTRRAEELNYRYFQKGRHTPLAIIVNNGTLTDSSLDVLQGYVNDIQGVEGAFGYLVLEGAGFDDGDPTSTSQQKVNIQIKPLLDAIQNDGLFQEYIKNNKDSLRESMRLAPIYTGASKDYTRATADVARAITEEQVFQPERQKISERISRLVNQALGIKYVEMRLNGPDITNKKDLAEAVAVYHKTGVITPNMVIDAVSALLNQDLEPISADWGNLPINIVLELVKQGKLEIEDLVVKPKANPTYTDNEAAAEMNTEDPESTENTTESEEE